MSSAAQALANHHNAQKSTGPRTPEGKATVSRNALAHGLSASPETLFSHSPALQQQYNEFLKKLRRDLGPQNLIEEQHFYRYAFAAFQAERAQHFEALAEADMLADFGNPELERRWMRFAQLRTRLAREADRAFKTYDAVLSVRQLAEAARHHQRVLFEADRDFQAKFGPPPTPEILNAFNQFRRSEAAKAAAGQTNPNRGASAHD